MMGLIADRAIFKMVGPLFINEEDAAMKGFDITSNLLGLEQLEYLDHYLSPPFQALP